MKTLFPSILIVLLFTLGCDLAKPKPRETEPEPVATVETQPTDPTPEKTEPETERVKADIGMTGKGQYGQGGGEKPMDIILVPVSQNFLIRERIALQQIEYAEKMYKAEHEKLPDTHEEYMRDVLQGMPLPKLPAGHKYVYDPKEQQLMIEQPKNE